MSRFADPSAVSVVSLGACQCPGTPHEQDEATVRWDLGSSALARIGRAELDRAVSHDPFAAYRQTVLEAVIAWNLLDAHGNHAPVTPGTVSELDVDTLKAIAERADELIQSKGTLPNEPGAPSQASPRGSASPTPKPRRKPGT